MTNKEYIEMISKKFEGETMSYNQDEVLRTFNNIKRKEKKRLLYRRWIIFIAILLGVMVFAGLLYWNLIPAKVNAEEQAKVEIKAEVRSKVEDKDKVKSKVENNADDKVKAEVYAGSGNGVINNKPSANNLNHHSPDKGQAPIQKREEQKTPITALPNEMSSDTSKEGNFIQEINYPSINIPGASYALAFPKSIKPQEIIEIRKHSFPKLNLASANGIGIDLGTNSMSYSLVENMSFLKRWSVTLGIKYSLSFHEKYNGEKDFYNNKQVSFVHTYDPDKYNYGTLGISNIDIQTKSFQLPLFINYKIGLKNNFNLLLSAGTNFMIASSQNVKFNNFSSSQGNPEPQTVSFVNHYIGPMFRDINIGVGLQHVWKHFSIDASPNLGVMINNPNNDKRVNGGVRVRVRVMNN